MITEIPVGAREWVADHPRVLQAACVGLLVFTGLNFYRAARLVIRCEDLVRANAQLAASEALGG